MAITKYKAKIDFEYKGKKIKADDEFILQDADGETLVKEGKSKHVRALEPEDSEDLKVITEFRKKEDAEHGTKIVKDKEREDAKDKELKDNDKKTKKVS